MKIYIIKRCSVLASVCLICVHGLQAQSFRHAKLLRSIASHSRNALEGFSSSNNSNTFTYQSLQGNYPVAMITRATDGKMNIDWNTAPVPSGYNLKHSATFLFLVDKDMGQTNTFNFYVNGIKKFSFDKTDLPEWSDTSEDGGILTFYTVSYDVNGDAQGYMTLVAPSSWLRSGKPLHLRITGEAENSNAWFMIFKAPHALARLQSRMAYENLSKIHYNLKDRHLSIDLKTTPFNENKNLTFSVGKNKQQVPGRLQDSVIDYQVGFNLNTKSILGIITCEIYNDKNHFLISDTLFQNPDTTYLVTNKGIILRQKKLFNPNDEEEIIWKKYTPSLAKNLLRLSDKNLSTLELMNSSHQDIAWMDSPAKCELMRDTLVITPLLKRMTQNPQFHFDIEDVLVIREYLHRHPDKKDIIQHFLDSGQLNIGGSFNMTYEDMYSGESLVREFYQGSLWMHKTFHYWPTTYWNVDVPGRTLQMPQILAKSGIKMMVLSRMGKGLFNWSAPDGSEVLTYSSGHYGNLYFAFSDKHNIYNGLNYLSEFTLEANKKLMPKENNVSMPLLWDMDMASAGGSEIIPRTWNHILYREDADHRINKMNIPRIAYSTSAEIYQNAKKCQSLLPNIKGARPNVWVYIHGPSHEWALHASRQGDFLLPAAEKFATMNALLKGNFDQYPVDGLHKAWEAKIYPDHGWGGKHGNITDNFFLQKYLFAKDKATNILQHSMEQIASKIKFKRSLGIPVVVFNSLSWKRDAPVNVSMHFSRGKIFGIKMINTKQKNIPCQLENKRYYKDHSLQSAKIFFVARQVPSIGYDTYYIMPDKKRTEQKDTISQVPENEIFESDYFKIHLANGGVKSIYDKNLHKELLNTTKFLGGEIFTMHSFGNGAGEFADIQKPDMQGFDKTSLHPCHWKVVADGPVFTALRFRTHIRYADAQLTVVLYKHLKRIDFKVDILNWEGVLYREFRMALPLAMKHDTVDYQVPFGILHVGQDELHRAAGERYTTDCRLVHPRGIQSWIGAYNDSESVTLSSAVAVADYIDPTTNPASCAILQPILLASRKSCNAQGNEYLQTGDHHFVFSFTSGKGSLSLQDKNGINGHVPLFAIVNPESSNHPSLNEEYSFLHSNNKYMIVTAVKKAENSHGICIRLYNVSGKNQRYALHFFLPLSHIAKTDLIERPLGRLLYKDSKTNTLQLQIGRYAIETWIADLLH